MRPLPAALRAFGHRFVIATATVALVVAAAFTPAQGTGRETRPPRAVESQPFTVAAAAPSSPTRTAVAVQRPVTPTVRSYAVSAVSRAGLVTLGPAVAKRAATTYAALSAPEPASGFAVTGATWSGRSPSGLGLAVRTRTDGIWSAWTTMPYDADHGPTPGTTESARSRPGTDPFVVGDVGAVQLRATSDTGATPRGLTLDIVDPGVSQPSASADSPSAKFATATADATHLGAGTTRSPVHAPSATPQPTIYSRAAWGADETLRDCCVEYGEVHAGFVHHTVNANDYTRAEVPAVLRGIYAYHTQSRGWRDIGYNFLVDRFGRIWEGRYGGIGLPVVGAHTLNYNENSFAASAIGNDDIAAPSAAMTDAYARLFAWKLSLHGVRPGTRQNVAGTTFDAISGHRDAAQTACPGRYLYARIPSIIKKATAYQHLYAGRDLQRSFVGDNTPDVLLVSKLDKSIAWARGTGAPGFGSALPALTGFATGKDQVTAVRDVTGDGRNDLMARTVRTRQTFVYPGKGGAKFGAPIRATTRWANTDLFAGPGDVTGDGRRDVVARATASGDLRVYPGRGDGTFGVATVAVPVAALGKVNLLSAAGDFDRDGFSDLLVRGGQGALRVLQGDGAGRFPTQVRLGGAWSAYDAIVAGSDLTGDGLPDVAARDRATATLKLFANVGGKSLSPALLSIPSAARPLALSPDVSGDHKPDLLARTKAGDVRVRPARRQNWLAPSRHPGAAWQGADRVMVVGDWDGDGYVDAMARQRGTGAIWLYRGLPAGGFGRRTGGWTGWRSRSLITAVGDFDGDGRPDLMARTGNGRIWLYPGRGNRGFGVPVIMRSSLPVGAAIVSVGRWNRDGAPDVLVSTSTGAMLLYPGNGPGGLDEPIRVGRGFGGYQTLLGLGDLTGDGQADLLGRTPNGRVWLIHGTKTSARLPGGRLSGRTYVGSSWASYLLG